MSMIPCDYFYSLFPPMTNKEWDKIVEYDYTQPPDFLSVDYMYHLRYGPYSYVAFFRNERWTADVYDKYLLEYVYDIMKTSLPDNAP